MQAATDVADERKVGLVADAEYGRLRLDGRLVGVGLARPVANAPLETRHERAPVGVAEAQ